MNKKRTMNRLKLGYVSLLALLFTQSYAQLDSTGFEVHNNPKTYAKTPVISDLELSDFTLESWIYIPNGTSNTVEKHVIETYAGSGVGGYVLRVSTTGTVKCWVMGGNGQFPITGSTAVPTGQWAHIAATYNSTEDTLKVFLSGSQDAARKIATTAPASFANSLYIGARGDDQNINANIIIDEVRIWNYAKTSAELLANMNNCLNGNETGLVLYYDFEDASVGIIGDKTSNGHDASVNDNGNTYLVDGVFECKSVLGITENNVENRFSVYPNPTNGNVNINLEGIENPSVKVFNAFGQLIIEKNMIDGNSYQLELNAAGIYVIKVVSEGKEAVYRVVKE